MIAGRQGAAHCATLRHVIDKTGQRDLMTFVAMAWGISGTTTDSDLDEIASQLLVALTEVRDELPAAPAADILGIDEGLTDRGQGWPETTLYRDGARAATDLVRAISTNPADWPDTMQQILASHCRQHGRPGLVAIVDVTTRLAASALGVITDDNSQISDLLEASLPPWL